MRMTCFLERPRQPLGPARNSTRDRMTEARALAIRAVHHSRVVLPLRLKIFCFHKGAADLARWTEHFQNARREL